MKADAIGINLYATFENIRESSKSNKKYSPIILHDEHRIQQVLLNLQSNALKFTTRGEVKIVVSITNKLKRNEQPRDSFFGEPEDESDAIDDLYLRISV